MSAEAQKRLSTVDAVAYIERMQKLHSSRDWRLTVAICNPGGLTAHQTVEVEAIQQGLDWTAGQLIVQPVSPLSMLTPGQVADITKSVRAGGSWHAYEREKRSRADLKAAQARIAELEAEQASRHIYRASVLEEAARVCEGEYLNEPQAGTEDIAYDHAVRDCASAIRVLAAQTQKDKP